MTAKPASIPRRHDLDALRAIAMLAGIALHAALAFMPLPMGHWPVQDTHQHPGFALFVSAVHGFRMPLFFLISGFFTCMLWRKRGLRALMVHRAKRILLPLIIGMFTVVPAVWAVSFAATGQADRGDTSNRIWDVAAKGDLPKLRELLKSGADPNQLDPIGHAPPLTVATLYNQPQAMQLLLESGADVDRQGGDGGTALHAAAFLGRAEAARLLLSHDARPDIRNHRGETAQDAMQADWGITQVIAGLIQVQVDKASWTTGRAEIAKMLAERGDPAAAAKPAPTDTPTAAAGTDKVPQADEPDWEGLWWLLTMFPVFHHLWFLWFLCWLVALFAIYGLIAARCSLRVPPVLINTSWRYLWLIPLTMLPQAAMGVMFPTFGPDTSPGLLPQPAVLVYYAIFFFFGVWYFDSNDEQGLVGSCWAWLLPISLFVLYPLGIELTVGGLNLPLEWLPNSVLRPLAVFVQVAYAWAMTFASIGIVRSCLQQESRTLRYLSDSSYWLYVAHLPLIILAQSIVRNWSQPSLVKFALICAVTSAILLVSYQYLVRYTFIGRLLNGPRERPAASATVA